MSRPDTVIKRLRCRYAIMWCIAWLCAVNLAYGQKVTTIRERDFGDLHQVTLADSLWSFHPGELSDSKKQVTDVSGWLTFRGTSFGEANPIPGWHGMGWFGLWVKVDTGLVNRK